MNELLLPSLLMILPHPMHMGQRERKEALNHGNFAAETSQAVFTAAGTSTRAAKEELGNRVYPQFRKSHVHWYRRTIEKA